jgi:hypothetical protein
MCIFEGVKSIQKKKNIFFLLLDPLRWRNDVLLTCVKQLTQGPLYSRRPESSDLMCSLPLSFSPCFSAVFILLFWLFFPTFSDSQLSYFLSWHFLYLSTRISSFVFASILISYSFSLSSSHFSFNFSSLTLSYSLLPSVTSLLSVALFFTSIMSSPFHSLHRFSLYRILSVHCSLFIWALWFSMPCPTLTDSVPVRIFTFPAYCWRRNCRSGTDWSRDTTCEDWISRWNRSDTGATVMSGFIVTNWRI